MAVNQKEIDQIKARLRRVALREMEVVRINAYARKQKRESRKGKLRAAKLDIFARGKRLHGSGFSS